MESTSALGSPGLPSEPATSPKRPSPGPSSSGADAQADLHHVAVARHLGVRDADGPLHAAGRSGSTTRVPPARSRYVPTTSSRRRSTTRRGGPPSRPARPPTSTTTRSLSSARAASAGGRKMFSPSPLERVDEADSHRGGRGGCPPRSGNLFPGGDGALAPLAARRLGLIIRMGRAPARSRLEAEALALLMMPPSRTISRRMRLSRSAAGVQARQPQEFLDAERVVGVCEDLLQMLRSWIHDSVHQGLPATYNG